MSETGAVAREKVYGWPELMIPGPSGGCPGCGHGLAGRAIVEAIEELGIGGKVILAQGVGCGPGGLLSSKIDVAYQGHGPAPAVATGIKNALFDDAIVITCQGDGDCAAIGIGYLISAAARAQRITVFMLNNTTYGTTGGQLGPTSLVGQVTATTPAGRDPQMYGYPLHVAEMLAGVRGVVYSARSAVNSPANYQRTKKYAKAALQKQIDGLGFGFLEILDTCPVNWRMDAVTAMKWLGEKVIAEFPLGEFKNADKID